MSHRTFATVVLPTPASPMNNILGIVSIEENSSFRVEGRIQSSMVCGAYFSTHKNFSDISIN
jgi:hypothetical protein